NSSNFRIFMVDGSSSGALALNGVTVTGGKVLGHMAAGAGGGILNLSGTLTLNSATVTGNFANDAGGGVASAFGATTTLNKSEVSSNTVPTTGSGGGGMLSLAATLTLNDSMVDHNAGPGGGGIASGNGMGGGPGSSVTLNKSFDPTVSAGTVTLNHTDVSGNTPDNCEPPDSISGCAG